ncbi:accessory Sec system protein Asp3 [Staphylococcus hominis]
MYGTTLQFKKEGALFKNPLMPSGTVIHAWHMLGICSHALIRTRQCPLFQF